MIRLAALAFLGALAACDQGVSPTEPATLPRLPSANAPVFDSLVVAAGYSYQTGKFCEDWREAYVMYLDSGWAKPSAKSVRSWAQREIDEDYSVRCFQPIAR